MRIDENGEHAKGFVLFNEPHAAHVGSEIVNLLDPLTNSVARRLILQISDNVFRLRGAIKPVFEPFPVDSPDGNALLDKITHQLTADKAPRAGNQYNTAHQSVSL